MPATICIKRGICSYPGKQAPKIDAHEKNSDENRIFGKHGAEYRCLIVSESQSNS